MSALSPMLVSRGEAHVWRRQTLVAIRRAGDHAAPERVFGRQPETVVRLAPGTTLVPSAARSAEHERAAAALQILIEHERMGWMLELRTHDVLERTRAVLGWLGSFVDGWEHADAVTVRATRVHIADVAGCSREQVGRALRTLDARRTVTIAPAGRSFEVPRALIERSLTC